MIVKSLLFFIASWAILLYSGPLLVASLSRIAKFLNWQKFVLAFVVMSVITSLPDLSIGIAASLRDIPQLSLGDILGGNLVDFTLALALAALLTRGTFYTALPLAQVSSVITVLIAILPLALLADGELGRWDGLILWVVFILYLAWLFSKKERFKDGALNHTAPTPKGFLDFLKSLGSFSAGAILMIAGAQGVVRSSEQIAIDLNLPIYIIGLLIVGLGNALPETYFSIASARKGESGLVLGNLMGSIVTGATMVLGTVALIEPIVIDDFSPFVIARTFLILSAVLFWIFVKTGKCLKKAEAAVLILLYVAFLAAEILHQAGDLKF